MVTVELTCPECKHEYEIDEADCPALRDAVEDAVDDAVADAKAEARVDAGFPEKLDSDECRLLGELACAIRAGDRGEAELLLDRLAESIGGQAQHEVSIGRYRKNLLLALSA